MSNNAAAAAGRTNPPAATNGNGNGKQAAAPQQQQQQQPLPDPKVAYDTLYRDVYASSFFGRLAQHGVTPATEKQAEHFLGLAGKLRAYAEDDRTKQAADAADPVAEAESALDSVLARNGFGRLTKAAQEADVARHNAAVRLANDANVYNAVLTLKAAQAQEVAERLGLNGQQR